MSNSIIDGTIVEARLKRAAKAQSLFDVVTFRLADGSTHSMKRIGVAPEVAALLTPGTSGRFYLYKLADQRGIHGVRTDDGRAAAGYPRILERLIGVVGILNLALAVMWLVTDGELRLLPTIAGLFCVVVAVLLHQLGNTSLRQFEADAGPARAGHAAAI